MVQKHQLFQMAQMIIWYTLRPCYFSKPPNIIYSLTLTLVDLTLVSLKNDTNSEPEPDHHPDTEDDSIPGLARGVFWRLH